MQRLYVFKLLCQLLVTPLQLPDLLARLPGLLRPVQAGSTRGFIILVAQHFVLFLVRTETLVLLLVERRLDHFAWATASPSLDTTPRRTRVGCTAGVAATASGWAIVILVLGHAVAGRRSWWLGRHLSVNYRFVVENWFNSFIGLELILLLMLKEQIKITEKG